MHFQPDEKVLFRARPFKVYLAGPLTNNNESVEASCREIRRVAWEELRGFDLAHFDVYDPAEHTPPPSPHTAEEVYWTDHLRTMDADLVLFHVNVPSLGVGIEAQIAADATVPRVVAYEKGAVVSRMFEGIFAPILARIEYDDPADFRSKLRAALPGIAEAVRSSSTARDPIRSRTASAGIGEFIFRQRILQQVPIDRLARLTDIQVYWLRRIERQPELATCLTLAQLSRIAEALECSWAIHEEALVPRLRSADGQLPRAQYDSLKNLVRFVLSSEEWLPDERVLRVWAQYREVAEERVRSRDPGDRDPIDQPVTVEGWRKRYGELGLF